MIIDLSLTKDQKKQKALIQESDANSIVFPAGRRYGKGEFAVRWQFEQTLKAEATPESPHGWIAPTYKQTRIGLYKYELFFNHNKIPYKPNYSGPYIDPAGNSKHRIMFFSSDRPENMEGFSLKSFVIDEAGIVLARPYVYHNTIQPMTMDYNAPGMMIGTPKGINLFSELHTRGLEGDPDYLALHATSYDNSTENGGYLDKAVIDRIANDMPERVRLQEIEAQFVSDAGGVFRNVTAVTTMREIKDTEIKECKKKGYKFIAGIDWGKHNDYTVISVVCLDTKEQIYLDRFNKIDYVFQRERLKAVCDRFEPILIIAEANSMGEPVIEELERDGLPIQPFWTTNSTKKAIIENLSLLIEREEIRLLDNEDLIFELQAMEVQRTKTGLITYNAPEGYHDDIVIATALSFSDMEGGPVFG